MNTELKEYSNEEMARNLSTVIRETRLLYGMTQAELADYARLNRSTIVKIEDPLKSGTTRMSTLHAVQNVLKINPNRLFYPEMTDLNSPKQILIDFLSLCSEEELSIITSFLEDYSEKSNSGEQ